MSVWAYCHQLTCVCVLSKGELCALHLKRYPIASEVCCHGCIPSLSVSSLTASSAVASWVEQHSILLGSSSTDQMRLMLFLLDLCTWESFPVICFYSFIPIKAMAISGSGGSGGGGGHFRSSCLPAVTTASLQWSTSPEMRAVLFLAVIQFSSEMCFTGITVTVGPSVHSVEAAAAATASAAHPLQ